MAQFQSVAGLERNMAAESEDRFAAYVEALSAALGHADRSGPFMDYCLGLLMPVERKSVEPLAAITAPVERRLSISPCCTSWVKEAGRTSA